MTMKILRHSVLLLCFAAAGCDDLSGLNPFAEKQKRIPGERHAILGPARTAGPAGGAPKTAALPAAQLNSEWTQPGGNAANAPGHLALGKGGWRVSALEVQRSTLDASLGRAGNIRPYIGPLVYQGRVYVFDRGKSISAHSLDTGGRIWSAKLDHETTAGGGMAIGDGRIYAVTGQRRAVALDAGSGQVLWSRELPLPARGAPTYAQGRLYFVTVNNTVMALAGADGKEVWSYRGLPESAGVLTSASPAAVGNLVVVPFSSGEIVALDAAKGTPKWSDTLSSGVKFTAIGGLGAVAARPVVDRGTVYAVSVAGKMAALNENTGQQLWTQPVASVATPAVVGDTVFVVDLSGNALALDRASGKVRWSTELPKDGNHAARWTSPLLAGGRVWTGSSSGKLVGLEPASGRIAETRNVGEGVATAPIAASGRLLVLGESGTLTAF